MLTTLRADDTLATRPDKATGTPTQNSYFKREDLGSRGSILFAKHLNDILGQVRNLKRPDDVQTIDDDTLLHRVIANYVNNLDLSQDADMTDLTDISEYNLQTDEGDFLYKDGNVSYVGTPRKARGTPRISYSVMYRGPQYFPHGQRVPIGQRRSDLVRGVFRPGIFAEEYMQIITWDHHLSTFGNNEPINRYHIISYASLAAGERFRIGSQTSNAYTEFYIDGTHYWVNMVNWRRAPVISQYRFL